MTEIAEVGAKEDVVFVFLDHVDVRLQKALQLVADFQHLLFAEELRELQYKGLIDVIQVEEKWNEDVDVYTSNLEDEGNL